ncbi:hypothetical protein [Nonomuraea dietziae]
MAILGEHIEEYGVAKDGRLFRTSTGGSYYSAAFLRVAGSAQVALNFG